MSEATGAKAPWHLWVIGTVALLWYVAGACTIFMAQAGLLPNLPADEAAYYAAQPFWFKAVTDVATLSAVAGSVLLLMRRDKAMRAFVLSLVAILVTHAYDIAMGTSRSYANQGAMLVNWVILMVAILLPYYVRAMRRRGILR